MFTRKLNYPDKIPEELLKKLPEEYIKPGAWDLNDENVNKFKDIMKTSLNELQGGRCAYCELPLLTRNPEIEHIAPKGGTKRPKHIECTFLPINLVYACHNCNSPECKGVKDTVINKNGSNDYKKWTFSIVHPYLDDPTEYFDILPYEDGNPGIIPIVKRNIDSCHRSKAERTIEMFKLNGEKVCELIKELMAKKYSKEVNEMAKTVSLYRPDLV